MGELGCCCYSWWDGRCGESQRESDVERCSVECTPYHSCLLMSLTIPLHLRFHSGPTNSGKTHTSRLFTSQLLRLSSSSSPLATPPRLSRLAQQVLALQTVLEAFGCSKTAWNNNASQCGRFLELEFDVAKGRGGGGGGGKGGSQGGKLIGGKVLIFGLNKRRLIDLERDERTFHVFYQLLSGASAEERDSLDLQDPTSYSILKKSGCYRLPGGPNSDDSTQFDELRVAFANLGFKAKHLRSMFGVLAAILVLGNLEFEDHGLGVGVQYESARVTYESRSVLEDVARRLGVGADDLEMGLTNETRYIRKEMCSSFLDAKGAERQRDTLVKDLYAILFAFVVESANRKLAVDKENDEGEEGSQSTRITQLDLPGYQNRNQGLSAPGVEVGGRGVSYHQPLISTNGTNGVEEFAVNFANEVLANYVTRRAFGDDLGGEDGMVARMKMDGIEMPSVLTMDNAACLELLRGGFVSPQTSKLGIKPRGLLGLMDRACTDAQPRRERDDGNGSEQDEQLKRDMAQSYGMHGSFMASPPALGMDASSRASMQSHHSESRRHLFGINHYSGSCIYDVNGFVDGNKDIIDAQLISLLRFSEDGFIAKLVSGPSIATETHPMDQNTIVQSQVSVTPLRRPTAAGSTNDEPVLDAARAYPLTTQVNATMSDILSSMDGSLLWNVYCIRPNDSGHANSFEKRRVKSQIRSFLLPDLVVRKQREYMADVDHKRFAKGLGLHYDSDETLLLAIGAFTDSQGWEEGKEYAIGSSKVWMEFDAWKVYDDMVRLRQGETNKQEDITPPSPATPARQHSPRAPAYPSPRHLDTPEYAGGGYGSSTEDLLLKKGDFSRRGSGYPPGTTFADSLAGDWDGRKEIHASAIPTLSPGFGKEKSLDDAVDFDNKKDAGLADMVVRDREKAHVEIVPTTKSRRWWVRVVWLLTWWIPSFLLSWWGRMKRPDMRMAWREKVAIFMMILGMCGVVLFYIILFGRLLCPNNAKAWDTTELATHTGTNDYYAAIAGKVYDVSLAGLSLATTSANALHHRESSSPIFTKDSIATSLLTLLHPPSCSNSLEWI